MNEEDARLFVSILTRGLITRDAWIRFVANRDYDRGVDVIYVAPEYR